MKRVTRTLLCALFFSTLIAPVSNAAPDTALLTICTSLRTGYQLISKTGKCNERIYEARTWFQKGSALYATPGSTMLDMRTCIRKSSKVQIIGTRAACNSKIYTTALWQRPLGPSVAPSITSVVMGLLGTATLNIAAPTEDGGAKVTSYLVTSTPGQLTATYTPAQIKAAKITGLTPGSSYSFSVVAINIKGPSPSSIASASTLAPTIPSAPSITKVIATGTNSAQLSFSPPLDSGGLPITSYVATSSSGSLQTTVYQSAGGTINITNLSHSTSYTFTLTAINAAGSSLASAISASITTATPPPPPEPVAPTPSGSALAAPAFTLSASSENRTVNTAATGFTINSTGGAIASFAISATPAGMSFSTSTGALTGTPTSVAGATAYTVTATNASGSTTATFTLTVTAALAAPAFTLSASSENRTVNTAATGFTINSTGGAIASFAISATPAGMSFSTSTGALTGTPTSVAGATAYTVTATNATGSTTATFTLTVTAALTAPAFTLSASSENRTVNTAATGFTINSTGGAIASFAISATPAGMSFSTSTGALTGTPTSVAGATAYTVTATNAAGSATQTFTLTVAAAATAAAITTQPTGAASGSTLATQPVIRIVDANGNTVTSSSVSVVASIASGSGTLSGTTTVTASSGIATFTNLVITATAGNFTLTFTPTSLTPVTSSSLSITTTTISVPAIAGVTAPVTGATPVSTTTAGTGYTGAVIWSGSPATFASATTYTATITLTPTTGYTLTGVTANFFTVAGATSVTNSVDAGVITAVFYMVGATGPGGGQVFYVAATPFNCGPTLTASCTYLEAAPDEVDGIYIWASDIAEIPTGTAIGTAIGTGYKNTLAMIGLGDGNYAGQISRAYRSPNNNLSDWFLPSKDEIYQMCLVKRGPYRGNCESSEDFSTWTWWSSTHAAPYSAYIQDIIDGGWTVSDGLEHIWPVRAFGAITAISVAAIAGLTAPVTGATPVSTTTAGTEYTGTVTWSGALTAGKFAAATAYTATITLTPTSGYTLTGVSANFFTVTGATSVTNSANAGVITAVFAATAAGVATAAAITTQPTGAASGSQLATQPVIRIVDASGNTVTSSTVSVVASIASGTGTLSGTTTVAAVAGIATFTNLVITATAGNFTLTFTPASLTAVTSSSLAITAGAASKVAITLASVGTARRSAFTPQPQITIQDSSGNTVTSSAALVTATVSSGGTLVGTLTATASSGVATFTGLGVDGTIGATYTITYTVSGLTVATATVTLTGTTCNGISFTCQMGDTGPGGGIVFYVAASTFTQTSANGSMCTTLCKYLEAAPSGWNNVSDPKKPWATGTYELGNATLDVDSITNDFVSGPYNNAAGVGLGYANSSAIVTQNGTYNASSNNYAAGAARAYAGGSKSDWYLPTTAELNLLCQWDRGVTPDVSIACNGGTLNSITYGASSAGLEEDYYWSSSEYSSYDAWVQYFGVYEDFDGDLQVPCNKHNHYQFAVRPVRSF